MLVDLGALLAGNTPVELFYDIVRGTYSLDSLIRWGGYGVLFAIVFAETGLLVGFFLPGDSLLFNPAHVERTRRFYDRHGAKTIVIARFVPIVRTFAPTVAGVGQMEYRRFVFYNVAGGIGWVVTMTWGGYLLGQFPIIGSNLHVVAGVVIVLSLIPIAVELLRERRRRPG